MVYDHQNGLSALGQRETAEKVKEEKEKVK